MRLRRAQPSDLAAIVELERRSPTAAHWNEEQYKKVLEEGEPRPASVCLVAEREGSPARILGFIVGRRIVAPEWEIENIIVSAPEQRKGIGSALLQDFLRFSQAGSVLLEVRESNLPALLLYKKCGFQESGRRKNYYSAPQEDAILLSLSLKKEELQP